MNNIFEKINLTLILFKIFHIYLCHYFATNTKIAITHLWHAMKLQTICHLIVKDKVAEQHILENTLTAIVYTGLTQQSEFQSSYYSAIQGATGLKLYYVIAYQKVDGQHI